MQKLILILAIVFSGILMQAQTQTEMNIESYNDFLAADKELNEVYQQILTDYKSDTVFIEKLRISQRLWIKFRDTELEMKYPETDKRGNYGSVYPLCANAYLEQLIKTRIKKLKEWLEPTPEGDVCIGSIKYRKI